MTTTHAQVTSASKTFERSKSAFRQYIPDLTTPRFQVAKQQDCYQYSEAFQQNHVPPWLYNLTQAWQKLYEEPFKGVTTDGKVIPNLYPREDQGVPISSIVTAANAFLTSLPTDLRQKVTYPLAAREWRAWSNPELLLRPFGLRLEDIPTQHIESIHSILRATLSPEGYAKALAAMRINHFLGEVCEVPRIMNQHSYNFLLFGTPSTTEPWGWILYGHHLCMSVFLRGPQIVVSPFFTGAEPNIIDQGPWAGTQILNVEGELGLKLMQSLGTEMQSRAQIFKQLRDPGMRQTGDLVSDRWNKDDQRHLCGAFRDNRVVPYEGVKVAEFGPEQKELVVGILEQYLLYLPEQARRCHLERINAHFNNTHFCWIGGYGDEDAFYFRIQSPIILIEFDHHSGVFLSNEEPAKFHTHTIMRMPNGGDYGAALRDEGQGPT